MVTLRILGILVIPTSIDRTGSAKAVFFVFRSACWMPNHIYKRGVIAAPKDSRHFTPTMRSRSVFLHIYQNNQKGEHKNEHHNSV